MYKMPVAWETSRVSNAHSNTREQFGSTRGGKTREYNVQIM